MALGEQGVEGGGGNGFEVEALAAAEDARDGHAAAGETVLEVGLLRGPEFLLGRAALSFEKAARSRKKLIVNKFPVRPGGRTLGGQAAGFGKERLVQLSQGWTHCLCRSPWLGSLRKSCDEFSIGGLAPLEGVYQLIPEHAHGLAFLLGALGQVCPSRVFQAHPVLVHAERPVRSFALSHAKPAQLLWGDP